MLKQIFLKYKNSLIVNNDKQFNFKEICLFYTKHNNKLYNYFNMFVFSIIL